MKNKLSSKTKDIIIRAFRTFIQAFIASISLDGMSIAFTDKATAIKWIHSVAIAGLAAGFSALWNYLKPIIENKISTKSEGENEV